jgi:exosome complex component RRP46
MTYTATVVAVTSTGEIKEDPSMRDATSAVSLHVLAFSSKGHLLLSQSEGGFDLDLWERVYEHAYAICRGSQPVTADGDISMVEDASGSSLESFVRKTVEDQLYHDYSWMINDA